MFESRCGIKCNECEYRDQMNCQGCIEIHKPFWGDSCPVKDCCEGRGHDHCGLCLEFPCQLLTQFAYDKEQGDNGKRIETCRNWANSFDVLAFVQAVASQNDDALRKYFTPDATICWHGSNEQFNVDEYIRANCEYPGKWNGTVERIEYMSNGLVIVSKIFSDSEANEAHEAYEAHYVTAFATVSNGKISRLDEYYSECGEAPAWRKEMKIGKPIV